MAEVDQLLDLTMSVAADAGDVTVYILSDNQALSERDDHVVPDRDKPTPAHVTTGAKTSLKKVRVQRSPADQKRFACLLCDKRYKTNSELRIHAAIHTGKRSFVCDDCPKAYFTRRHLREHQLTHRTEKSHACAHCGKAFLRAAKLQRHLTTHAPYRRYQCICYYSASQVGKLVAHKVKCSASKCTDFSRLFDSRVRSYESTDPSSAMARHVSDESSDNQFECVFCSNTYKTQTNLRAHFKFHTGVRYACDLCGKSYNHNSNLREHKLTHYEEKPYKCPECHKSFISDFRLRRHRRTHSKGKTYLCEVCFTEYDSMTGLIDHRKANHDSKIRQEKLEKECTGIKSHQSEPQDTWRSCVTPTAEIVGQVTKAGGVSSPVDNGYEKVVNEEAGPSVSALNNDLEQGSCAGRTSAGRKDEMQMEVIFMNDGQDLQTVRVVEFTDEDMNISGHGASHDLETSVRRLSDDSDCVSTGAQCYEASVVTDEEKVNISVCNDAHDNDAHDNDAHDNDAHDKSEAKGKPVPADSTVHQETINLENYLSKFASRMPLKCPHCYKSYNSKGSLRSHIKTHAAQKPYPCDQCELSFKYRSGLREHKLRKHDKALPYQCAACGRGFVSKYKLDLHKDIRHPHPTQSWICEICFESFKDMRALIGHKRKSHSCHDSVQGSKADIGEKTTALDISTPESGEDSDNDKKGRRKRVIHTRQRSIKSLKTDNGIPKPPSAVCNICHVTYSCRSALYRHMRKVHQDQGTICSLCQRTLPSQEKLQEHMKDHHEVTGHHVCHFCGDAFPCSSSLQEHTVSHRAQLKHQCLVCERTFKHLRDLKQHEKTHGDIRPYTCDVCGKGFPGREHLAHHMARHNQDSCMCELCGQVLAGQESLKRHMKAVHSPDSACTCHICGKELKTKKSLRRHLSTHSAERNFLCECCGTLLKHRISLKHHAVMHANERTAEGTDQTRSSLTGYDRTKYNPIRNRAGNVNEPINEDYYAEQNISQRESPGILTSSRDALQRSVSSGNACLGDADGSDVGRDLTDSSDVEDPCDLHSPLHSVQESDSDEEDLAEETRKQRCATCGQTFAVEHLENHRDTCVRETHHLLIQKLLYKHNRSVP